MTILSLIPRIKCEFKLTIIHNNDFHANYLPIKSSNNAECYDDFDNNPECVAGVARTVAKVKQFRKTTKNLLFLNAGDHFQGTSWYTLLKSEAVFDFVRLMNHDVMSLGNHEFDDGPEELEKFLQMIKMDKNINLPIVCCNIELNELSILNGLIKKSVIRSFNGTKVAIIGYLTPETKFLSTPGELIHFRDEIIAIQEEIDSLKARHPDLKIFIGLGHSGYDRDMEIAEKISDLDLIVGGHSHTYLFSGKNPPSSEQPMANYPSVVEHHIQTSSFQTNKSTLIVQAYAYGKYLGWIEMLFDDDGEIRNYKGEPIFLDHNSPQDAETKELVKTVNKNISSLYNSTYGVATKEFPIRGCRWEECAIGNLITESFIDSFKSFKKEDSSLSVPLNSCDLIALINGGNIRTSIDEGPITYRHIISTLPFGNTLGLLTINGSELIRIFHHSAQQHHRGGFLQISGLRVTYKIEQCNTLIKRSRLIELKARCNSQWNRVEDNQIYQVIINNFLVAGGDNYSIDATKWKDYQIKDSDLLSKYISKLQNVTPFHDGRISNGEFEKKHQDTIYVILILMFSILWENF